MQLRDPTLEAEPNFEDVAWEAARNAITAGGKTLEEAIEILKEGWKVQHERAVEEWIEQRQLRQQEREQDGGGDQEQGGEQDGEQNRGQANLSTSSQRSEPEVPEWINRPTPSFLDIRPSEKALKRLEKKEFVELWYFTAEGCRVTAAADLASPDDTYGLVNTDKGLVFQTLGASSMSVKVTRDEDLTLEQMTEAKTRLVGCMKTCGWNEYEVTQTAMFYMSLDVHPMRSQPYGRQAILRYQDRVRRDWTSCLKTVAYSIAEVNNDLMKEFRDEIRNEVQAKNDVSVLRFSSMWLKLTI